MIYIQGWREPQKCSERKKIMNSLDASRGVSVNLLNDNFVPIDSDWVSLRLKLNLNVETLSFEPFVFIH